MNFWAPTNMYSILLLCCIAVTFVQVNSFHVAGHIGGHGSGDGSRGESHNGNGKTFHQHTEDADGGFHVGGHIGSDHTGIHVHGSVGGGAHGGLIGGILGGHHTSSEEHEGESSESGQESSTKDQGFLGSLLGVVNGDVKVGFQKSGILKTSSDALSGFLTFLIKPIHKALSNPELQGFPLVKTIDNYIKDLITAIYGMAFVTEDTINESLLQLDSIIQALFAAIDEVIGKIPIAGQLIVPIFKLKNKLIDSAFHFITGTNGKIQFKHGFEAEGNETDALKELSKYLTRLDAASYLLSKTGDFKDKDKIQIIMMEIKQSVVGKIFESESQLKSEIVDIGTRLQGIVQIAIEFQNEQKLSKADEARITQILSIVANMKESLALFGVHITGIPPGADVSSTDDGGVFGDLLPRDGYRTGLMKTIINILSSTDAVVSGKLQSFFESNAIQEIPILGPLMAKIGDLIQGFLKLTTGVSFKAEGIADGLMLNLKIFLTGLLDYVETTSDRVPVVNALLEPVSTLLKFLLTIVSRAALGDNLGIDFKIDFDASAGVQNSAETIKSTLNDIKSKVDILLICPEFKHKKELREVYGDIDVLLGGKTFTSEESLKAVMVQVGAKLDALLQLGGQAHAKGDVEIVKKIYASVRQSVQAFRQFGVTFKYLPNDVDDNGNGSITDGSSRNGSAGGKVKFDFEPSVILKSVMTIFQSSITKIQSVLKTLVAIKITEIKFVVTKIENFISVFTHGTIKSEDDFKALVKRQESALVEILGGLTKASSESNLSFEEKMTVTELRVTFTSLNQVFRVVGGGSGSAGGSINGSGSAGGNINGSGSAGGSINGSGSAGGSINGIDSTSESINELNIN